MPNQNTNNGHKKTGLKHLYHSFLYSLDGFKAAFRNEAAFRQEILLVVLGIAVTFFLPVSIPEKVLLIVPLFIILITELLNSAIEAVVDRVSTELHPLSKTAKDLGSAAVFTSIVLCVLVWIMVLWHHFFS